MSRGFDASGRRRHVQDFGRAYQNATNVKPCRKHQCLPQDLTWIEWRHDDLNLPMFSQKVLSTPLAQLCTKTTHTHKTQEETKEHEGTKSHHNATTVLYARNPTSLSLNSFLSQFSPANIHSKNLFDFVIVVCYCVPLGWCFNPLWNFMFFHWVENDLNDLVVHALHALHNLTLHASGSDVARCARDHCMELQAAVRIQAPGSCYIWSRENVESHINKIWFASVF